MSDERNILESRNFGGLGESNIILNASDLRQSNIIPRYGPEYLYELDQKRVSMKMKNGSTKDILKEKSWHKTFGTERYLIVDSTPTASIEWCPEMEFLARPIEMKFECLINEFCLDQDEFCSLNILSFSLLRS
jgi:hypothetical protein